MMRSRSARGPLLLFLAWAVHDIEEALTFPQVCYRLAERTGREWWRMDARQSWCAVGLMGGLNGERGEATAGESRRVGSTVSTADHVRPAARHMVSPTPASQPRRAREPTLAPQPTPPTTGT